MEVPYTIDRNEHYGRYLAAARDIKQGEIIMKEKPELLGSQISAFLICFKCSTRIYTPTPVPCSQCKLAPTCGYCQGKAHAKECRYMKELTMKTQGITFQFLCENPQVTMPLRCLLLKYSNNDVWNEFLLLESHLNERKGTYIYNLHKNHVEQPLKDRNFHNDLQLSSDENVDLLQVICGILDVNTFEVRPTIDFQGPEDCLRGLYLKPALMAHNCLSNTHLSVDDDFLMTIRASLAIGKGEMIAFNYTNGLQGNFDRQRHLQQGKYFTCECKRCVDPSELGTGLSTLICPKCRQATLICNNNKWQCHKCAKTFSGHMVRTTLQLAKDKVHMVLEEGNLQDAKALVHCLRRTLHGQHNLIIEMNQKIISLLSCEGDEESTMEKIDLCQELMAVLTVIEPGISRHQGIAQYELHNAKLHLAKVQYNASLITLDKYLQVLKETEGILKGSIGHLIYEPKSTPEGRLAQKALTDLQVLRATIKDISTKVQKKALKKHKH